MRRFGKIALFLLLALISGFASAQAAPGTDGWLRVITINVQGLPWPMNRSSNATLQAIARELHRLQPDVVLVQEAFTEDAQRILKAGWRYSYGPTLGGIAPLTSGLIILSRHPMRDGKFLRFGIDSCAGIDCMADKGVLYARMGDIHIFNTHMNAREASEDPNWPQERREQAAKARRFIQQMAGPHAIIGGDFNGAPSAPEVRSIVAGLNMRTYSFNRWDHIFTRGFAPGHAGFLVRGLSDHDGLGVVMPWPSPR
ncbi:MAG: endonuclease/exonuclease/phosphatase family protein [Magnetospiraceae bacterium]